MDFSEKLLTLRKANNLTQEQLAEKLDVSRQSVSKWINRNCIQDTAGNLPLFLFPYKHLLLLFFQYVCFY